MSVEPEALTATRPRRRISPRRAALAVLVIFASAIFIADVVVPAVRLGSAFGRETPLQLAWSALRPAADSLADAGGARINVLLLGLGWETGTDLTDTILLASFAADGSDAVLLPVPRDLSIVFPDGTPRKINTAYHLGEKHAAGTGGTFAAGIIGDVLGTPIERFAVIDIGGLETIVDDLGGIPLPLDRGFTDQLLPDASFDAGWQWLSGHRALTLMRARHGDNGESGDFARSLRQQKVVLALRDRLFSPTVLLNPAVVQRLVSDVIASVRTNLRASEIIALARLGGSLDVSRIRRFSLPGEGVLVEMFSSDGTYVLQPAGDGFGLLQRRVNELLTQAPSPPPAVGEIVPAPQIVARAEWDADPPPPEADRSIRRIVIHHVGTRFDGPAGGEEKMRHLLLSVAEHRGWSDVPYHYVVDVDGRIYEGRSESRLADSRTLDDVSGLHIALQGNYESEAPAPAQLAALVQLVQSKARELHVADENIFLHSDLAPTKCPGALAKEALAAAPWHHAATAAAADH